MVQDDELREGEHGRGRQRRQIGCGIGKSTLCFSLKSQIGLFPGHSNLVLNAVRERVRISSLNKQTNKQQDREEAVTRREGKSEKAYKTRDEKADW